MKKFLTAILSVFLTVVLFGCVPSTNEKEQPKVYGIGDTQTMSGIDLTVTKVESREESKSYNGYYVIVYFTVKTEKTNYPTIFYTSFYLNDSYTKRNSAFRLTDIPNGHLDLVAGNEYNFRVGFDCKYSHEQADMIFIWNGLWYDNEWHF